MVFWGWCMIFPQEKVTSKILNSTVTNKEGTIMAAIRKNNITVTIWPRCKNFP